MKKTYDGLPELPREQIYDFDSIVPPFVDENVLRKAAAGTAEKTTERRKLRGQIALLFVSALLIIIAAVLGGFLTAGYSRLISAMCFGYAAVSAASCGTAVFIFMRKGGIEIC